jgi:hypothetical protein
MQPNDPIQPEEIILRRVPEAQMDPSEPRWPRIEAFGPHPYNDTDGLSVYRAKFHTPAEAAGFRTKSKKKTWIAMLKASSITALGLTLRPDPLEKTEDLPEQPGHALIVEMRTEQRLSYDVDQWKNSLLAAVIGVEGPFEPPPEKAANPPNPAGTVP